MELVFLGTGPVAAASLAALADDFTIECVITKLPPTHHKGSAPVAELAEKLGLPLVFANTRQELDDLIFAKKFASHLGVIVDYGVIVSRQAIDSFALGIVNSHFSLLPQWRGADPITFTVLSGQAETGVSLMLIVEQLDEGPLIAQEPVEISPTITTPELTDRLVNKSNEMLRRYLPEYVAGSLKPYDQSTAKASYSRKLTKADGIIDWNEPAITIERKIRAFTGWPRARTNIADMPCTITTAKVGSQSGKPGGVEVGSQLLRIYASEGCVDIQRLIPSGKKEMPVSAFLAGYKQKIIDTPYAA